MEYLNYSNIRCKCRGCYTAERIIIDEEVDEEAACTFGPWFDNVLQERGLVVLRHQDHNFEYCEGPYDDLDRRFDFPNFVFDFNDDIDCHLFESITDDMAEEGTTDVRWGEVCIGERLWSAESMNNQWIKKFVRIFSNQFKPLSSPPTPPASPKMAPQPPPPLRITTTIDQGLKLQELEKQLATQAAEIQTLKEQLATQAAETQLDRDDSKRKRP